MRRCGISCAWCWLMAPVFLVAWAMGLYALADPSDDTQSPADSHESSTSNSASSAADSEQSPTDPQSAGAAPQLPAADAELPWNSTASTGANRSPADIRELLPNISEGDLAGLHDGEPIDTDGQKVLYRLLNRTQGITPLNFQRFAVAGGIWKELAEHPSAHRVAVVLLSGRAKRVERIALTEEEAELFAFDHYDRVTLAIDDAPGTVVLCARRAPSAWPVGQPIDEPASAYGLFFKLVPPPPPATDDSPSSQAGGGSSDVPAESDASVSPEGSNAPHAPSTEDASDETTNGDESPDPLAVSDLQFVFVGYRVGWFPEKVNSRAGVTDEHVLLARLGMDIGLLDDLRALNGKPLSIADREPLYQMLAAVSRCDPKELARLSAPPLDMAALITEPEKQHGRLMTVEGVARRITRIEVPDPDIRERFGIEAYYEVEVFVPLGNLAIPVLGEKEDSKQAVIDNRYPVTVFVTRLPPELAEFTDKPGDQTLTQEVRIRSFSYRAWSYNSPFARQFGKQTSQIGPMLIGSDIEVTGAYSEFPGYMSAVVAVVFLVALGSIWLVLWRTSRKDARVGRKLHGESPGNQGQGS